MELDAGRGSGRLERVPLVSLSLLTASHWLTCNDEARCVLARCTNLLTGSLACSLAYSPTFLLAFLPTSIPFTADLLSYVLSSYRRVFLSLTHLLTYSDALLRRSVHQQAA